MKTNFSRPTVAGRVSKAALAFTVATLIGAAPARAASTPSDLLEKGIYSEETKGDLDGAIQLYQQVVSEAKGGRALAAQAQYHLGVCLYKQKKFGEANAAFEKVVSEYADQKEIVAQANQYLAGAATLLPAPWADGEEMRLDIKFPTGFKLGVATYTARLGETNGQKIWRLSSRLFAGVEQLSRVEVEADSFKPLHCRWKHTLIGDADTTYSDGHAKLKMAGQDEVKDIELTGVTYDNEEAVQLMRRCPLTADYKRTMRIFTGLGGGATIDIKFEVTGEETVQVPAGSFDCYKVELGLVHQTFWVSTDSHHYIVKFSGGGVVGELAAVTQRKEGQAVIYQDPAFGFSLTAPEDWVFNSVDPKEEKGQARVIVLDPEALATTVVNVGSMTNLMHELKPEAQKSLRAWADYETTEGNKALQELKIRPESWKDRPVGGHPGLAVTGDFVEGDEKKVGYAVFTQGQTNAAVFVLMAKAKDFDAMQPKFEAIVDSYKGQ